MKPIDEYNVRTFVDPTQNKFNEKNINKYDNIMPVVIQNKQSPGGGSSQQDEDIQDLMAQGWKMM